jgi:hypothetical protein
MNKDNFLSLENFNWSEHAFSILYKFIPHYAESVNSETEYASRMTKGLFGTE